MKISIAQAQNLDARDLDRQDRVEARKHRANRQAQKNLVASLRHQPRPVRLTLNFNLPKALQFRS